MYFLTDFIRFSEELDQVFKDLLNIDDFLPGFIWIVSYLNFNLK